MVDQSADCPEAGARHGQTGECGYWIMEVGDRSGWLFEVDHRSRWLIEGVVTSPPIVLKL